MTGRLSRAAVVVALAFAGSASIPARAGATPSSAPATPIHHLVVMTQDQHSFDNYFGTRSGVDGLPSAACVPKQRGSSTPCVKPFPVETSGLHLSLVSSNAVQNAAINRGRMDGFVYAQSLHTNAGKMAMGYYRPQDIPVLNQIANRGVLFDHWFSSVPAGTIPNRLFAVAAQAPAADGAVPSGGWGQTPMIFDRLQAAGVSWRIYVEHYEPALTITTAGARARQGGQIARVPVLGAARLADDPSIKSHVVDLSQYFADLAAGKLPAVSYIVTTSSTERPPDNPTAGQVLARNVLNSLSESTAWSSSAFMLHYDSAGGWYDHVAPPTKDGALLGPRVPGLLVSPYTSPGSIDHTVVDSASILKFIESNWSLAPLTNRDRDATNLTSAFTFGRAPRAPSVIGAGDPQPAVIRPNTTVIYAAYTVVLTAVVLAAGLTVASERRKRVSTARAR